MDAWWWFQLVLLGLGLAICTMLLYYECHTDKWYDAGLEIEIIDTNGWDTGNSGQPTTVKCGTCGWVAVVPYDMDSPGVAEEEAERHRLEHERDGRATKSSNKTGVTHLKKG